jgi:hypothetical protein
MKIKTLALAAAIALFGTCALAQSPGTAAGSSAGGSSASAGDAASSTTSGSSMNGDATGNDGPGVGLSLPNSVNNGPPSNAVGSTGMGSRTTGAVGTVNQPGAPGGSVGR